MADQREGSSQVVVTTPLEGDVEMVTVSVQVGDRVRKGSVLCQYQPLNGSGAVQTLKSSTVGIVRRVSAHDGDVLPPK